MRKFENLINNKSHRELSIDDWIVYELNNKIHYIENLINIISLQFYSKNKFKFFDLIDKAKILSKDIDNLIKEKDKILNNKDYLNSNSSQSFYKVTKESKNFNLKLNIISLVDSIFEESPKPLEELNRKKIEHTVFSILNSKLLNFNFVNDSLTLKSNPMEYLSNLNSTNEFTNVKSDSKTKSLKKSKFSILKKNNDNEITKFLANLRVVFMARSQKNLHKVVNYSLKGFDSGPVTKSNLVFDEAYKLLQSVFKSMYSYISKPIFKITKDKITIQLFYYLNIPPALLFKWFALNHVIKRINKPYKLRGLKNRIIFRSNRYQVISKKIRHNKKLLVYPFRSFKRKNNIFLRNRLFFIEKLFNLNINNLAFVFPFKFKILLNILSHFFNKNIELDLIRLHHPQLDTNILATFLAYVASKKNIKRSVFNIFRKKYSVKNIKLFSKFNPKGIPSYLSGLNIRLAGRLLRGAVASRVKTSLFSKGANSPGKINVSDVARVIKKSKRGTFSITVKSSHNFY